MTVEKGGARIVIPCPRCATFTHHALLHTVERSEGDEDQNVWWHDHYQILECHGCKTVSFRHLHTDSEMDIVCDRDGNAGHDVTEELYPHRAVGRRRLPEVLYLPTDVRRIYIETHQALVNDSPVLAGIGIRAIVETVCTELDAHGRDLEKRIDNLVTKQLLTPGDATVLHKLRVLGNKAAHEVKPHSSEQLSLAMDVVEHLLQGAYVFPEKAAQTLDLGVKAADRSLGQQVEST